MRVSFNAMNQAKKYARAAATSVVPYTRTDLTKKWMGRIQAKAKDSHSQETLMKLSSLIDYYNKPAESFNEVGREANYHLLYLFTFRTLTGVTGQRMLERKELLRKSEKSILNSKTTHIMWMP